MKRRASEPRWLLLLHQIPRQPDYRAGAAFDQLYEVFARTRGA
jgi:hypothetical protein